MNGNKNVLTPGYWMLFALNSAKVPSVSKIIRVERDGGGQPPVTNAVNLRVLRRQLERAT